MARDRARKRRIEVGLDLELRERPDIKTAERAALRAQARAIDTAERDGDSDRVTRANAVYLELRQACGLTSGAAQPVDAFSALLAELSKPTAGASDTPQP